MPSTAPWRTLPSHSHRVKSIPHATCWQFSMMQRVGLSTMSAERAREGGSSGRWRTVVRSKAL